ncbi:MAG: Na(+)-translocating NADH-quinone reductase subunit A [Lysobacterales bacterium]
MNMHIKITKGLNLRLGGEPEQSIHDGPEIHHVALCGQDYIGLKPRLLVSEGDAVAHGQPLFIDKTDPDVNYCSPAQGVIAAINRGRRRVLDSIVVRLDRSDAGGHEFEPLSAGKLDDPDQDLVAARLQQSGLWTAFRTRPFSRVPHSDSRPDAIFVTATDSRPLCADPAIVVQTDPGSLITGLRLLPSLTPGAVYLCTGPGWDIRIPEFDRISRHVFSGPHPAGLPGTHIHHLYPAGLKRVVWQIGYQDVMAIGKLFSEGRVPVSRVIALGGACVARPRLVKTQVGASLNELLANEIRPYANYRVLSGSALDGRTASASLAYLGRYHNQVSVIPEGGDRRLFGWLGHIRKHPASTSQHGRFSAMIPLPVFEKLMPLDILPAALFRALLVKNSDQAQALGCLELDEEDLALCAYLCPAKTDYGYALRVNLNQIERGG